MRKPDYCPEWFDIDLYDNLKFCSRDELCLSLWTRKMNYQNYLHNMQAGEDKQQYALEWLVMLVTKWLKKPVKPRSKEHDRDNYNPLKVEPNIIQEVTLSDVMYLYGESYMKLPDMRDFFQKAPMHLDEAIEQGWTDQACEQIEWILSNHFSAMESELKETVSEKLNYSDMFHIDLTQSDEVLKMAFEEKLKEIREKEKRNLTDSIWGNQRTKRFSDSEIKKIVEYRIFAYIDLYTYGLITGRKFTDIEMAAMIYPPKDNTPLDFDAVDRIARTVRPKATELFERINPRLLL